MKGNTRNAKIWARKCPNAIYSPFRLPSTALMKTEHLSEIRSLGHSITVKATAASKQKKVVFVVFTIVNLHRRNVTLNFYARIKNQNSKRRKNKKKKILISFEKYLSFCDMWKKTLWKKKEKKIIAKLIAWKFFLISFSNVESSCFWSRPHASNHDDAARENLDEKIFSFSFVVMVSLVHIYALISRKRRKENFPCHDG